MTILTSARSYEHEKHDTEMLGTDDFNESSGADWIKEVLYLTEI